MLKTHSVKVASFRLLFKLTGNRLDYVFQSQIPQQPWLSFLPPRRCRFPTKWSRCRLLAYFLHSKLFVIKSSVWLLGCSSIESSSVALESLSRFASRHYLDWPAVTIDRERECNWAWVDFWSACLPQTVGSFVIVLFEILDRLLQPTASFKL